MKSNILITGGTGSFGSFLIEYLLKTNQASKIIIFSRDELKQHDLKEKLSKKYNLKKLRFFLGDVRDYNRLKEATKNVDTIIHAAALKQVPAAEYNPMECIKTNILGAQNVVAAALENKVLKILALSTDKAVNPINLYGATKLCSDKLIISGNNIKGSAKSIFSVVRYGNVFNSRGSVFSAFKYQNENMNSFSITDKDMTRFNISLENSVKFVLSKLKIMKGGEIFIPKLDTIKITDLAKAINPKKKIKIIGIRPGEKIHEVLCPEDDAQNLIEFKDFFVSTPSISFQKKINYINYGKLKGKKVKKNFQYDSKSNNKYLSISQIKSIIKNEG